MTTSALAYPQPPEPQGLDRHSSVESTLTPAAIKTVCACSMPCITAPSNSAGPRAIEIIDRDLGTTAASADHRAGFKEALAQVTWGHVGILLSFDVTRLSRNCSAWYPLLDFWGSRDCFIADRDGVYDPGSPNGRLLLGRKGQISELELHTIKARMTAGILNTAQRGDLALPLPVGFVREALGTVHKDPPMEVQSRRSLLCATFLRLRAASQV